MISIILWMTLYMKILNIDFELQKKEVEILTRTNKSEIKQIIAEILINYDLEYKECSYNPSLLKISI